MKRKIAFILAAVMMLSLVPMNVFAASDNRVVKTPTVIPEKSILTEDGVGSTGTINTPSGTQDEIKYLVNGTDYLIELKDPITTGTTIRLELENAVWFFRSFVDQTPVTLTTPANYGVTAVPAGGTSTAVNSNTSWTAANFPNSYTDSNGATITSAVGTLTNGTTYNPSKGTWIPSATGAKDGTYYRSESQNGTELGYKLEVSALDDRVALLTIAQNSANPIPIPSSGLYQIRIPVVCRTTAAADVRVKITNSNITAISTDSRLVAMASSTLTNTYVKDPPTARDLFYIDKLVIKEERLGSIKPGYIIVEAPSGFTFANPTSAFTNESNVSKPGVVVSVESGLGGIANNSTGRVAWQVIDGETDYSSLRVNLSGLTQSTNIAGAVYLDNIRLYADTDAPFGDITFKIKNENSDVKVVTEQSFKAAVRADWTITFKTEGTIPTLVNGRYDKENQANSVDAKHLSAKIIFEENSAEAWWAERQTLFTLPTGVKIRKVEIKDNNKFDGARAQQIQSVGDYTEFSNGNLKINKNVLTLTNFDVKRNEKARLEMWLWLSIESGFEGDVTLACEGSGVPSEIEPIVIAKAISPITIETVVKDVKIGFQFQDVADFTIYETAAGILEKGKIVNVSLSDEITGQDGMAFIDEDTVIEVVEGDLKLSNVNDSTSTAGILGFTIKSASTKPSAVKYSNVRIKIDRTVPETNYTPYKVIVGGTAIAPNYGKKMDQFRTYGIKADYIKVVTPGDADATNKVVKVTIGDPNIQVGQDIWAMDTAAYISTDSNSTMVPVRFVSVALGIADSNVVWDNVGRSVTIYTPYRVIQFAIGSDQLVVNGIASSMLSPDGKAVKAEIRDERSFIPFRALGQALGKSVSWDDASKTAIYNAQYE